jgi:glutathionylspermidine synthase
VEVRENNVRRYPINPRPGWENIVSSQGLNYHSVEGRPYWDESAYWEFTSSEVDRLEAATAELQKMCLAAGDYILRRNHLAAMHISEAAIPAIRGTWKDEPPALYGRMDLAYDGYAIKLLEYNADTPTSLIEAAVIQWYWLQDRFPTRDQWNSLHERLVAKWRDLVLYVQQPVHFAHDGDEEDLLTISYLRDTAREAGIDSVALLMHEIGWDNDRHCFVGHGTTPLATLFKLYPWETLLTEPFGMNALVNMASGNKPQKGRTQWIEPIWKMLWSNKALLAILWEMYPDHEFLLPAYLDGPRDMTRYVRKPILGREGANISIVNGSHGFETDGRFADGPWVYQGLAPVRYVDGNYAVLGSWLIDGEPAGLGMRESHDPVIRNTDRFVPHLF